MKVLISTRAIYPFHGYGGMQKYFYYLSRHLVKQGINAEILSSSDGSGRRSTEFNGIKYTFVPPNFKRRLIGPFSFYPYYSYFNFNALRRIRRADFDIVHGLGGVHDYLLLDHRRPVVLQVFGLESFKETNLARRIFGFFMAYPSSRFDMLHADAVAAEGEAGAKEIMSLFKVSREKIFCLPDGVDLDEIDGFIKDSEITKEELKIRNADITLININRLEPNKGVSYLLEALKILNQELDVRLIMIGTGSEEAKIRKQIESLGMEDRVLHFRNVSDKKKIQLCNVADISVTPTLFEGLPMVVLEAMACKKPIIASNIPEMRQVVRDRENGFLVKPANSKIIAEKVLEIYDKNLFKPMGLRSREIIRSYDWSKVAKIAIDEYEELIGK